MQNAMDMRSTTRQFRWLALALPFITLLLWGCQPDLRNYEAEIEEIHFEHKAGQDTMLLVSDTLQPTSTNVSFTVSHQAKLKRLVPVFRLSPGATANVEPGRAYDFSQPFTITVTSENTRNTRQYTFTANQLPAPPIVQVAEEELSGEAQLGDFRLEGVEGQVAIRGTRMLIIVPDSVDLSNLSFSFTLSEGATCDYEQGAPYDFTEPLYIRVTAADGQSCVTYRIIVRHPEVELSPEAQVLKFRFGESRRSVTFEGARIYAEVEAHLDIKELTPIFSLSPGAKSSLPLGEYADFSQPVKMEVTSEDASAKSIYTILVSKYKRSEIAIDSVGVVGLGAPNFKDSHGYTYIVDNGVDISELTPRVYTSKGCTTNIAAGYVHNFTEPLQVTVTAEDGLHSRSFTIQVVRSESGEQKEKGQIQSFGFENAASSTVIHGGEVHVRVPFGTDLSHLVPTYTIKESPAWLGYKPGALYFPGQQEPIKSGIDTLDFSGPVQVEVWRKWGASWAIADVGKYTIHVSIDAPAGGEAKLRTFEFSDGEVTVTRRGNSIAGVAAPGTSLTALQPVFTLSEGATANMVSGQPYDFSKSHELVVTSSDGGTKEYYQITVEQRLNDRAELVDFRLAELPNAPTVSGATLTFFAGQGVNIASLTPTFSLSRGARSNVEAGVAQDFSRPLRIMVTSEDGNISRTYTIVVEQRLNYEAELLSFRFAEFDEPCTIKGTQIVFDPRGRAVTSLTPIFELSPGATSDVQSGVAMDFSKLVRIKVTSEDKSVTKSYTVRMIQPGIVFDFEQWQSFESGSLQYEHPVGAWSSGNVGMAVSKKFSKKPKEYPVQKSSDAHGGRYAARISTEALGVNKISIAAGALFLGSFNGAVVMDDPLSAPQFGTPWSSGKPDRFTGWYKYKPGATMIDKSGSEIGGTDEFALYAILFYGETLTAKTVQGSDRIIAIARVSDCSAKSSWTPFDIAFEYLREAPSGVQLKYSIVMSSSKDGDNFNAAVGSVLLVDDLEITLK